MTVEGRCIIKSCNCRTSEQVLEIYNKNYPNKLYDS